MSQFTTTRLAGSRTLVQGTDSASNSGSVVLDSAEYDNLFAQDQLADAHAEFDAAVEEFFAPITEAADKLEAAHRVEVDPSSIYVVDEGEAGVSGRPAKIIEVSHDTQVLRLVQSDPDRLLWVNGTLEITEFVPSSTGSNDTEAEAEVHEYVDPSVGIS